MIGEIRGLGKLKGKKVLVCGLARSGRAAAQLLLDAGAIVSFADSSSYDALLGENKAYVDKGAGIRFYLGQNPDELVGDYDLIVISPGIPIDTPFVLKAKALGVPLIGEVELGYMACEAPIAAITGTNGKTTATTITGDIFRRSWAGSETLGNIGVPFCEKAVSIPSSAWVALEVSSFQLESVSAFRPRIAAVLNISEDHLNRHYTMENYIASKERIFAAQTPEDLLVLNYDDPICRGMAARAKSEIAYFSMKGEPGDIPNAACVFLSGGEVIYRHKSYYVRLWSAKDMKSPFTHVLEDAMAAALIALCAGAAAEVVSDVALGFAGVEHRVELVGVVDGVEFYNDSKATNVDAAIKALSAIQGKVILIGGGQDKQADFSQWISLFDEKVKALVVFGETAGQIVNDCQRAEFWKYEQTAGLSEAVAAAKRVAQPGDRVLFSPACASLDMFSNYEERGRLFKEYVLGLSNRLN